MQHPTIIFSGIRCLLLASTLFFTACGKDNDDGEALFYGTWVGVSGPNDTLRFYRKNDQNIMFYNASFNPSRPAPTEATYSYKDGKFHLNTFPAGGGTQFEAPNFRWNRVGEVFTVMSTDFYPILSSMQEITYRKL